MFQRVCRSSVEKGLNSENIFENLFRLIDARNAFPNIRYAS
ncbi:MAG: hypothetical protein ACI9O6_002265 [Glaciecola sp.]|jgi:hypothetical protein